MARPPHHQHEHDPDHDQAAATRRASGHHLHLWRLADGTGLHAPPGELTVDPLTGRLCCHLCGEWFRSLGAHVRSHGYTAAAYRDEMGLLLGEALTDAEVSARISARQTHRYEGEESLRAAFAVGQDMARSGELGRLKSAGTGSVLVATRRSQRETLSQGRRTQRARRRARLEHLIATAGFGDLGGLLQARYCGGATLESLAVETGLGRAALRAALDEAGVVMRPTGHNTPQGRRSRSRTADQAAAQRVGTDDLSTWLRSRREQGWTLAQLGAAVGHSGHWVRWRLDPARPNPADPADPADLADPAEPVEVTR